MQKTGRKPLFDLGQPAAATGALATLEKTGQPRWNSSRAMCVGFDSYVESLWQEILWT
jgi:hypothetical protein